LGTYGGAIAKGGGGAAMCGNGGEDDSAGGGGRSHFGLVAIGLRDIEPMLVSSPSAWMKANARQDRALL
jgi:hypothetical protein